MSRVTLYWALTSAALMLLGGFLVSALLATAALARPGSARAAAEQHG